MDVLLDAIDDAVERLRQRHPKAVTLVGLLSWLAVAVAATVVFTLGLGPIGLALLIGPGLLLLLVAWRGLDRLGWIVWPVGVSPLVAIAGVVAPMMEDQAAKVGWDWLVVLFVFGYVQVFLGALTSVHFLRFGGMPGPSGLRRPHQLKLLIAMELLMFSTDLGDAFSAGERTTTGGAGPVVQLGLGATFVLGLLGVWWRSRALAGAVAFGLVGWFGLYLSVVPAVDRNALALRFGWLVVTTAYLWLQAARAPYWPLLRNLRDRVDQATGSSSSDMPTMRNVRR